jgi:hypothetical protein
VVDDERGGRCAEYKVRSSGSDHETLGATALVPYGSMGVKRKLADLATLAFLLPADLNWLASSNIYLRLHVLSKPPNDFILSSNLETCKLI